MIDLTITVVQKSGTTAEVPGGVASVGSLGQAVKGIVLVGDGDAVVSWELLEVACGVVDDTGEPVGGAGDGVVLDGAVGGDLQKVAGDVVNEELLGVGAS